MTGEAAPAAVVSLVRRNRPRYGGYIVHVGMALLFVGVAASSAFQHERDVRLAPGQTTRVGDYPVTYVRNTAKLEFREDSLEAIRIGAQLRVQRDGHEPFAAVTERRYFPANAPFMGPLARYFAGEATSEIALKAGGLRDFWAAYQPDQDGIQKIVAATDRRLKELNATPQEQAQAFGRFVGFLRDSPSPGTFRIIASPLVSWIWLGGLV